MSLQQIQYLVFSLSRMPKLSDCDNLLRVSQTTAGRRVICFTRAFDDDTLGVYVSDGVEMWKVNLEKVSHFLTQHLPKTASPLGKAAVANDSEFIRFKTIFLKGDMTISESGNKINLSLNGQELTTVDLQLPEATLADKKKELQAILFHLTDKLTEMETSLKTAETKIEALEKKSINASAGKSVFDMTASVKRKKTGQKAPPKAPGMSVINPGSKKRTAPKGVQFD